jgi:hypothetical protein
MWGCQTFGIRPDMLTSAKFRCHAADFCRPDQRADPRGDACAVG